MSDVKILTEQFTGVGDDPDQATARALGSRAAAAGFVAAAHGGEAEQASYGVAPAGERGPDGPAEDIGAPSTAPWDKVRPTGPSS